MKLGIRMYFDKLACLTFLGLSIFILTGCTFKVKYVGEYDQVIDTSVTELQQTTIAFFTKMKQGNANELKYENNKRYYEISFGKLASLIIRSSIIEKALKKKLLNKNFLELEKQFSELMKMHKGNFIGKKYFEKAEEAFSQSFRAIMEYILYLKWNIN